MVSSNEKIGDMRFLFSDVDVFIYRHFADYIPQNCTFITGGGGYGTIFNRRKLTRIAYDMGFTHANISGMGSTWFVVISLFKSLPILSIQVWYTVRWISGGKSNLAGDALARTI